MSDRFGRVSDRSGPARGAGAAYAMGESTVKTVHARTLGLRIAALAATALVLTACNDDTAATGTTPTTTRAAGSPSATGTGTGKAKVPAGGRPSNRPSGSASSAAAGNAAAAQARTDKLVLSPADWGSGFQANGDDDTSTDDFAMDKSCVLKEGGRIPQLLASTTRYVKQEKPDGGELWGESNGSQFATADAAHKDIADHAADIVRCPDYKDGTTAYSTVHESESPEVPGADEVYSEEGLAVYDTTEGGRTDQRPFSYVIARKGPVIVSVFVDLESTQQGFEGRALARKLLQKMTAKW